MPLPPSEYDKTVQYLNHIFILINEKYFSNQLETPTITIQSTLRIYGHITTHKVWHTEAGKETYELNIGANYLNRPIQDVVTTLIHECCHLYALQNNIKDTSNNGVYHNKNFARIAQKCELITEYVSHHGYARTRPSPETIRFCTDNDLKNIEITRAITRRGTVKYKRWVCPCCGAIIRSTKYVNVICGDCKVPFKLSK